MEIATLAGGCFWCTEALFRRLKGVSSVVSGYAGGNTENPNYDQIHSSTTGHTETIQLTFDPKVIPYERLLEIFFHLHDPTTKNRQGADVGSEYRSIIFYHNNKQKQAAAKVIQDIEKSNKYPDPIITELVPYTSFYKAEEEHQNFYEKYPMSPYCLIVIDPKIKKLLEEFGDEVKEV